MSVEEIFHAIAAAHGEVTLSPRELLALANELEICWQKIGELEDRLEYEERGENM